MTLNLYVENLWSLLAKMERAQFEFHLTGSRFFGRDTSSSDWDFFVEYYPDLADWLAANGFCKESKPDYGSEDIVDVWKNVLFGVHVQVIINVRLKAAVQTALRNLGFGYWMYSLSQEDRKLIWRLAFRLFEAGKAQVA